MGGLKKFPLFSDRFVPGEERKNKKETTCRDGAGTLSFMLRMLHNPEKHNTEADLDDVDGTNKQKKQKGNP